ncbi:MAG: DUF3137 domain-containing protein [Candidatus Izemoplasmatales bacterium]|nr:DUF3137 domain-containing protein [Candidatus Izemoplasmatales bacterium]
MIDNKTFKEFNERKNKSEKKVIIAIVLIIIAIIGFLLSETDFGILFFYFGVAFGVVGVVYLTIGMVEYAKIKNNFKSEVLTSMFKTIIPNVNYLPDKGLSEKDAYSSEFLKHADRYHSEDYISGRIGDVDFVSSDVKLEERHVQHTKNGTRVYYVTYFLGRVFRFDFNKVFTGNLQVLESGSPYSRRKFEKVKMESVDFNKKFKIFTEEELTAFYILTPDIMEAIFNLEKRNPGRISMSFLGDHLYVAINNNRDTFELQMFRKLNETVIEEFKQDLLVIKDFIVSLKLNNKLFKKD